MNVPIEKKRRLKRKAKQSACNFKIAAFGLNSNGDVVSKQTNRPRFARKGGGIHAEMAVMREARQKGVVYILLCRISKDSGNLMPIHPCPVCQAKADELGIKIQSIY